MDFFASSLSAFLRKISWFTGQAGSAVAEAPGGGNSLFGGRTSLPCSGYSIGGGLSPPPSPVKPTTGPKIDPIPCHRGAAPSSPAQLGKLTKLADVNAKATAVDRKPKPIVGASFPPEALRQRSNAGVSRHEFRLFDDGCNSVNLGPSRSLVRTTARSLDFGSSARGEPAISRESRARPRC